MLSVELKKKIFFDFTHIPIGTLILNPFFSDADGLPCHEEHSPGSSKAAG